VSDDSRWTDEAEQLVLRAFTDTYDTRAALARTVRPVLTALADAGLLVTPQMREVVETAREEAQLIRLVAAVVPGSMSRGTRARLLAAVDTYEATREERQ